MSCTAPQPRTVRTINLKTGQEKRQVFLECKLISQHEETEDEFNYITTTTEWLSRGTIIKHTSKSRKDGKNPKTIVHNWHSTVPRTRVWQFRDLILKYGTVYPFINFAEVARLMGLAVRAEWYNIDRHEACILEVRTDSPIRVLNSDEFVLFEQGWNGHQDSSAWTHRYW